MKSKTFFVLIAIGLIALSCYGMKRAYATPLSPAVTFKRTVHITPTIFPTSTPFPAKTFMAVTPTPRLIEPLDSDVEYVAKTIHGEAGICNDTQKKAVAWCILNRVDCADFPNTIEEVVTQPHQFHGYAEDKVPTEEECLIAYEVIKIWLNDLDGRILPKRFLFFHAENGQNVFTTNHRKGEVWKN